MNLFFVYNANSGLVNSTIDALHKVVSPQTYKCSLCSLTHGVFKEKKEWNDFSSQSNHEIEFLYKDEFEELYQQNFSYPCVLSKNDSVFDIKLDVDKMNSLNNLEDLIDEIKNIKA